MHRSGPPSGLQVGRRAIALSAGFLLLAFLHGSADAQVQIKSDAIEIDLTGRMHVQWNTTSVDFNAAGVDIVSNQFLVRRARFTAEIKISDLVSGKLQPEYALGIFQLKDAYVDLTFDPAFIVRMGQFKRGFDFFGLESSTQSLVIERTGAVRGVNSCSGVGRICSYSRFTERLEYSDRDIGLSVGGILDGKYVWSASVTNGEGQDRLDVNDAKSFSGRFEYRGAGLRVGGNVGAHDFVNDSTGERNDYGIAYGADLNWGDYKGGLHVQAGVVAGDNWRNLVDAGNPSTFATAQGIVTYMALIRDSRIIEAVEPVGRVSWGDPDTDASDDDGFLFTPGFVFHFTGRNKFAINADVWSPSSGDSEWALRTQLFLHF